MISGQVDSSLEPTVVLTVRGDSSDPIAVPFVIDTGYTGQILLSSPLIVDLQLRWLRDDRAMLADGSIVRHEVFAAWIEWDGELREVSVDESDSPPLIGTALLRGYVLNMQMRRRGKVTIKRLPSKKRKP